MVIPISEANKPKKTFERKNHLQVVNMLMEFISTTTIIKRIHDLGMNLTVG